jgi:protein SCO1/2
MASTEPEASSTLRTIRRLLWIVAAVAGLVFAFLFWRTQGSSAPVTQSTMSSASGSSAFTLGGPFTLTSADGQRFASRSLAGKPYVLFFGFTHCPDVCPTTLARLARLRSNVGAEDLQIVFVSVDPQRDTPAALRDYAALFDTPVIMLTGTPDEVAKVAKQHGIYVAKVPSKEAADGYTMDHSAASLLFDKAGAFVATIAPDEPDSAAIAKLKRITA